MSNRGINGFELPDRIMDKLNEASGYFGDSFKDMVLLSIEENIQDLDKDSLKLLAESIQKESERHHSIIESELQIQQHFKNGRMIFENESLNAPKSFLDKLKISNPNYMNNFNVHRLEEAQEDQEEQPQQEQDSPRNTIEGDGDTPDDGQPDQSQQPQEEPQVDENGNPIQPEPDLTDEQKLQLELAQTDAKFVTIVLYDKIVELLGSIKTIKENMSASKTETELDMYTTLEKYESYLEILNELIFVMDLNTIYYNVVNIMVEVNDLLNKYLISTKVKVLNNPESSREVKDKAIADLKTNNDNSDDTNEEIDDMEE